MNTKASEQAGQRRLKTWHEWYHFARETLNLQHSEAADYATARYLEEQNRRLLRDRAA
jgi:hypothetical protein